MSAPHTTAVPPHHAHPDLRDANVHRLHYPPSAGLGQHLPGPIGTLTAAALTDGEVTSKVTQAGPATMIPPVKPVKRRPHTGSRTLAREAASSARPAGALISPPIRDGEPYTSLALAGRVMETVAYGAAAAETARKAL